MQRQNKPLNKSFFQQLKDKLEDPKDGEAIRAIIAKNDRSRLFDNLPNHFYSIFDDYFVRDSMHLVDILFTAKAIMTDEGDLLTDDKDKEQIKDWCKNIMHRGAAELLSNKKQYIDQVLPQVLKLLGKSRIELPSRDLICAYFAAINQCVMTYVAKYSAELLPGKDLQFRAFIQYMNSRDNPESNNFSLWAKEVLEERIDPSIRDRRRQEKSKLTTIEKAAIGTSIGLGLLTLFGGLALALKDNDNPGTDPRFSNNNNSSSRPSSPGFDKW